MCEGMLTPQGVIATCIRCSRVFPLKEIKRILKLLEVVNYEPASDQQQGPTKDEKRNALNLAATKLARLKLKVMDLEELRPEPPAPPPMYRPPVYAYPTATAAATVGFDMNGNSFDFRFGNVAFRVTLM